MIRNFITLLRPYGGKNLPSADFAFMFLDIDELYNILRLFLPKPIDRGNPPGYML